MIVERTNHPLRAAQWNPRHSVAAVVLLLFGMALTAVAQPTDTTARVDTTGRLGGQITEITPADTEATTGKPAPWLYIGAYGGLSLISYDAFLPPTVFRRDLALPPSSTFTTGDGSGALLGVLAELPLGESFNVGVRLGYQIHSGQLIQNYVNTTDISGADTNAPGGGANVQGTVDTKFGHVSITPYARVAPFSFPLYFYGGPTFLIPAQANFVYTERIGGPPGARYRSGIPGVKAGTRPVSRTLNSGDFSNAATTIAISAGVGYEQSLNDEIGLFGELQFQPMLGDYLSGLRTNEFWTGSSISVLVGVRYGLISSPSAPPPPPRVIAADTAYIIRRPADTAFGAVGVTSRGLSDTITVSARRVKATEVHALLPYIFFDRDSAIIPERYVRLEAKNRSKFQIERLPRGSTMDIYYNLLNIVGQRIRDDRVKLVTVTGCISQFEKDSSLALRRAQAVRDYLVNVWRIPTTRIKVVAQGLPESPSLSEVDTVEASRENQRVEIASDGYVVERPVQLPDTTLLAPIGVVRFLPPPQKPDTSGLVDGWSLDVKIGDSLIKRAVTGTGAPPKQIDYEIENRPDLDLRGPVEVSSTLTIRDTLYQDLYRLNSKPIVVKPEGAYEEERNIVGGKYVDTYNLLLFNFDKEQATNFSLQASDIMKHTLDTSSRISIIGHTDRIGLPYYNQALSLKRAQFAAQLLNITTADVAGHGEKELLYDNKFPEGRYYSRTVTVTIETPIPGQTSSEPARRPSSSQRRKATGTTTNGTGTAPDTSTGTGSNP